MSDEFYQIFIITCISIGLFMLLVTIIGLAWMPVWLEVWLEIKTEERKKRRAELRVKWEAKFRAKRKKAGRLKG